MVIAALSMVMSQSKAQTAAGIAVTKIAMDTRKENANQMTEMLQEQVGHSVPHKGDWPQQKRVNNVDLLASSVIILFLRNDTCYLVLCQSM